MIIDSHAHYALPVFDGEFPYLDHTAEGYAIRRGNRETMLADMRAGGIVGFIEPAIRFDEEAVEKQMQTVARHEDCMWAAIGLHPTRCHRVDFSEREKLSEHAKKNRPVAIGETGLDYHHPRGEQHRRAQKRWFKFQIRLAHELNLPLILHIRDADKDALRILKRRRKLLRGGVVHCFKGNAGLAQSYISLGFAIGIGGKLLADGHEAKALEQTVREIPLSSILVETDAPYVLPDISDLKCGSHQRKKLCNSSLILPAVLRRIAELRSRSAEEVENEIFQNTLRTFHLPDIEDKAMKNKKKLFVLSDLHGHFTQAKEALDKAGFDAGNEDHLFVHCGDLFDRGRENRAVLEFVQSLPRKVLVKGNHDERLYRVLTEGKVSETDFYNGMRTTLTEFFGADCVAPDGTLDLSQHADTVRELCGLIGGMVDYFESERYVFVHGWLPTEKRDGLPHLLENWQNASEAAWQYARFSRWMDFIHSPARLDGKTIVCGHRPTRLAAAFDPARSEDDSSTYESPGMMAIDAGTIRSGRVNLLVLEDEILNQSPTK